MTKTQNVTVYNRVAYEDTQNYVVCVPMTVQKEVQVRRCQMVPTTVQTQVSAGAGCAAPAVVVPAVAAAVAAATNRRHHVVQSDSSSAHAASGSSRTAFFLAGGRGRKSRARVRHSLALHR